MYKQKERDAVEALKLDQNMAEQSHPRLFNSFVNHIRDNDLTQVDSSKVEDAQPLMYAETVSKTTSEQTKDETSLSDVFNVV